MKRSEGAAVVNSGNGAAAGGEGGRLLVCAGLLIRDVKT